MAGYKRGEMTVKLIWIIVLIGLMIHFSRLDGYCEEWVCEKSPREAREVIDPETGAKLLFVTTHEGDDQNLYFHDRSWLPDESVLLFTSNRNGSTGLYGYVEATGEILNISNGQRGIGGFTASKTRNSVYLYKESEVCEWSLTHDALSDRWSVKERLIHVLPAIYQAVGNLSENADSTRLSVILKNLNRNEYAVTFIQLDQGKLETLATVNWPIQHLQCSWTDPDLVMFARTYPEGDRVPVMSREEYSKLEPRSRIWFARRGVEKPWPLHEQVPGELVTHECWWVNDTLTFCGGYLPEESHLKTASVGDRMIRILGPGRWWPNASSAELAKHNWWHASGSPDGKWVAADNWHGDIVLFNAMTTKMRLLTVGHRTYGGGVHPHVGWSPSGKRVVFSSNRWGNGDVCVGWVE